MSTDRTRTVTWADPLPAAKAGMAMSGIDYLQAMFEGRLPGPPVMTLLGMEGHSVEPGRVVFALTPAEYHYNPIGTVHGGVIATLLDSAMACAVHSELPEGQGYTTLEFKVNFVRPLTQASGPVTCEGKVIHRGRSQATAEGRVTDAEGRLYAHATTTCMILPAR
ncbi:MAG TPA: PaaI family thioesterase [Alphaproteobacteria bacterium]|nr:PaaI family thioesterase [Alphaproteobacteria bacterium]